MNQRTEPAAPLPKLDRWWLDPPHPDSTNNAECLAAYERRKWDSIKSLYDRIEQLEKAVEELSRAATVVDSG